MNFFHTRHSLDQGVQQISRRKTIYYGKKYLEKYKKKCADILKNKNYVTKKSIKAGFEKILTNVKFPFSL